MLFGTFRNPKTMNEEAGFYDGASSRVGEMLLGRDVSEPETAQPIPHRNAVSDHAPITAGSTSG